MPEFEKAFSDFQDSEESEQTHNAIFILVRLAFKAGWKAAGGEVPPERE